MNKILSSFIAFFFLIYSSTTFSYTKEEYNQYLRESKSFKDAIDVVYALRKALIFCLSDEQIDEYNKKATILAKNLDNDIEGILSNGIPKSDAYAIQIKRNTKILYDEYENICFKDFKLSSKLVDFIHNYKDYYGDKESKPIFINYSGLNELSIKSISELQNKSIDNYLNDIKKLILNKSFILHPDDVNFIGNLIKLCLQSGRYNTISKCRQIVLYESFKKIDKLISKFETSILEYGNFTYDPLYDKPISEWNETFLRKKINEISEILKKGRERNSYEPINFYKYFHDKQFNYIFDNNSSQNMDINYAILLFDLFHHVVTDWLSEDMRDIQYELEFKIRNIRFSLNKHKEELVKKYEISSRDNANNTKGPTIDGFQLGMPTAKFINMMNYIASKNNLSIFDRSPVYAIGEHQSLKLFGLLGAYIWGTTSVLSNESSVISLYFSMNYFGLKINDNNDPKMLSFVRSFCDKYNLPFDKFKKNQFSYTYKAKLFYVEITNALVSIVLYN